jgi:4-hydroxybenzoate polyprenyltransferase
MDAQLAAAQAGGAEAATRDGVLPPLAVDMDGTVLLSDTLHESLLALLRANPLYLFVLPFWLLGGKAHFKRAVARRVVPDPATFAFNEPFLAWLRTQHGRRRLVLCTAADAGIAHAVASHLQLFDEVLSSDGRENLAGHGKAAALARRFGERGFDYAANARIDTAAWAHARHAVVVNAAPSVQREAARVATVAQTFPRAASPAAAALRALRPHQWAKNLLVFVPVLTAHLAFDPAALAHALLAFVAFCLCASSVYVINDLVDLPSDRAHPRKRHRPFASGALPVISGMIAAPLLALAAFAVAALLPARFLLVLAAYFALTFTYSLWFKRVELLDVVVLASLYTGRIVAGAFAIAVPLSFWLLAFSMFLFLSLAMVKRHAELALVREQGRMAAAGRGYRVDDLPLLATLGGASGYLSVLVLALYINSRESAALYHAPQLLWLLCPLLLYWISRVWLLTMRGQMHDDPVLFALRDPPSLAVGALGLAAVALSA